jgi:protein LTV1
MQHLKTVGEGVDGDAVLIAAPRGSHAVKGDRKARRQATADDDDFFKPTQRQPVVVPDSVLPSNREMTREEVLESQSAVPRELQGLQPDMDPHLRQVLEALEDEAFVDEQVDDDGWMNELLGGGEREGEEDVEEWDFAEQGLDDEGNPLPAPNRGDQEHDGDDGDDDQDREETWQDRFKAFKSSGGLGAHQAPASAYDEGYSEAGDTVGSLPAMSVIGGKKRRKGTSDASGYSMSSSSMFRNKGLSTLDEMFDKVGSGSVGARPSFGTG